MGGDKFKTLDVLIITGAPGVGKSTIARVWAKRNHGVSIEADEFTTWIHHQFLPRFSEEEGKLVAELAFSCTKIYLDHGMSVAVNCVFSASCFEFFKSQFENYSSNLSLKFIWLSCELDENHRRDKMRIPDHQMGERVAIVNQWLDDQQWPEYMNRVNSTHQSVNETILEIARISKVVL